MWINRRKMPALSIRQRLGGAMSASPHLPQAIGPEGGSGRTSCDEAARPCATSRLVRSLLPLAIVLAAGCSDDNPGIATGTPTPSSSATPTATTTPTAEQDAILSQYRTFWASLTSISEMPAAQRRAALDPLAVDPALKSLLSGMQTTEAKGQVFYGANKPRATQASVSPDGLRAVIDDCQDSTTAGVARRSDMAPLTKGRARNHVVVTMQKSGATWKVYFVSYT
jgi:hypothetical protein